MSGIPLHFKPLDPTIASKSIEGHADILTSEHRSAEVLYNQHKQCPRGCGSTMQKSAASVQFAFSDTNWMIPRCIMKCSHCGCSVNPFNGMVVELGKPDEANAGAKIIRG